MTDLQKILKASSPLTLAGVPQGFQPCLLADLARGAKGRAVYIAPDESAMRAVADTASYFAPELQIIRIPLWACLTYDRSSPSLRSMSERLAGLPAHSQINKTPPLVLH